MCDWREDGPQGLEAHSNVQQMGSKEEVVIVTQDGHGHVPGQIQEGLQRGDNTMVTDRCRNHTYVMI